VKTKAQSKTIRVAAIIAVLGAMEMNWHLLQDALGEWYGGTYIAIAGLVAYLRIITTGPVK
jgi:hypothetical protein